VNRAAWQRRHKLLVDGRLFLIILPLLAITMTGWFIDVRFFLFLIVIAGIWFAGFVAWQIDPWMITRAFINLESPRKGAAVRRRLR